jgi:hypothetical protein
MENYARKAVTDKSLPPFSASRSPRAFVYARRLQSVKGNGKASPGEMYHFTSTS